MVKFLIKIKYAIKTNYIVRFKIILKEIKAVNQN